MNRWIENIVSAVLRNKFLDRLIFRHTDKEKLTKLFLHLVNRETIVYVFFGFLATVVSVGSFWLVSRLFAGLGWAGLFHFFRPAENYAYLDATALSWLCAVFFAFVTNKLFVFESKSWRPEVALRELGGFLVARLLSLGVEGLCMFLLVSVISLNELLSKAIVQVIIVIINYVASKLFIFKDKPKEE